MRGLTDEERYELEIDDLEWSMPAAMAPVASDHRIAVQDMLVDRGLMVVVDRPDDDEHEWSRITPEGRLALALDTAARKLGRP